MNKNQTLSFSKLILIVILSLTLLAIFTKIEISPFKAFGGAVWQKNGIHYVSDEQIQNRIEKINIPKEVVLSEKIKTITKYCDDLDGGYCQKVPGEYFFKTLVKQAVEYEPAVPDKKIVIGYCTLCSDGTWSPSCAIGSGACSWHGGVAAYNVAQYRTIYGTPEVPAQPAVYSYEPSDYKKSPYYIEPATPSLDEILNF